MYVINEEQARVNRQMWSMRDYTPGTYTNEFNKEVKEMEELVEQAKKRTTRERDLEKLDRALERFMKGYAKYLNNDIRIQGMCPSVLISGFSNFPVRKKEKQNRASERNRDYYSHVMSIKSWVRNFDGTDIRSDDDDALDRLKANLEREQAYHKGMVEANKYYRKHKTLVGANVLDIFKNFEPEKLEEMSASINSRQEWDRIPFHGYTLTNHNAKMKNIEARIKNLERLKSADFSKIEHSDYVYEINQDDMRIRLFFDGKPDTEVIKLLKSHAFKWSPRNQAWQRQLTSNGLRSSKELLSKLNEFYGE